MSPIKTKPSDHKAARHSLFTEEHHRFGQWGRGGVCALCMVGTVCSPDERKHTPPISRKSQCIIWSFHWGLLIRLNPPKNERILHCVCIESSGGLKYFFKPWIPNIVTWMPYLFVRLFIFKIGFHIAQITLNLLCSQGWIPDPLVFHWKGIRGLCHQIQHQIPWKSGLEASKSWSWGVSWNTAFHGCWNHEHTAYGYSEKTGPSAFHRR